MQVNVYNTHIEIFPYEKGDLPKLETRCSIWLGNEYRYDPMGYVITNGKMIIPKGIPISFIKKMTGASPNYVNNTFGPRDFKSSFGMRNTPKNNDQRQAINFLISEDAYSKNKLGNQYILNVDTGFGKTYCMINAINKMHKIALVITNTVTIKQHWIDSFKEHTTMKDKNILDLDNQKIILNGIDEYIQNRDKFNETFEDIAVIMTTHSMITDFCNKNGGEEFEKFLEYIGVGVKVVDEAHLFLRSMIRIDLFTNIDKNYYLTATFDRSNDAENTLYKRVFANANKYSGESNARKHVNYKFILFNSKPSQWQQNSISTFHGTSSYKYADYAFKEDKFKTLEGVMFKALNSCLSIEGRTLVVVPKIENTFYLEERLKEVFPNVSIGVVNSKSENNDDVKENSRIIISTIKSLGVGADISKLRNLIIAEPHSSKIISNQLIGRLREYSPTEDTYVYELVDNGFPQLSRMISHRYDEIVKKCKKVTYSRI